VCLARTRVCHDLNVSRVGRFVLGAARDPRTAVGVVTALNLWILRPELLAANTINDTTVHHTIVDWAAGRLADGQLPLDGWFPRIGLGFPVMHHYQTLPHLLSAVAARAIGVDAAIRLPLFVLLGTWPIAVYLGLRLMRLSMRTAAIAAVLAPWVASAPSYGFEHGSYVWRGLGLWTQLWGMWLFPIALGLAWRAIEERRGYAPAALVTAGVICCHLQTGYLLLVAIGLATLARRADLGGRMLRGAIVIGGSLALSAWLLVPIFTDQRWTASSEFNENTVWVDSFGARKVLGWLVTGRLFDKDHPPVLTVLLALGLGVAAWRARREAQSRVFLALFGVSLVLFCGRAPFGPVIDLIPGMDSLLLHRFISGVQFAGVVIAAIAVDGLWQVGSRLARVRLPARVPTAAFDAAAVIALGVALFPASTVADSLERQANRWLHTQQAAEQVDGAAIDALVATARAEGPGRFYAGLLGTNGGGYLVGSARAQSIVQEAGPTEVLGYSLRLPAFLADVEPRFDETNPAHYTLFDVRYVIQPDGHASPPGGTLVQQIGRNQLYRMEQATGAIGVVDTQHVVAAERDTIGKAAAPLLGSWHDGQPLPVVAFAGEPPATPTLADDAAVPAEPVGRVLAQSGDPDRGDYGAVVETARDAVVVLRSSFHPRMHATVDGTRVQTQIIGPGFVGVAVGPGRHTVAFHYAPYPRYPLLVGGGVIAFGALAALGRASRRWAWVALRGELVDEQPVAL
jgi:hypothetical protein